VCYQLRLGGARDWAESTSGAVRWPAAGRPGTAPRAFGAHTLPNIHVWDAPKAVRSSVSLTGTRKARTRPDMQGEFRVSSTPGMGELSSLCRGHC